MILLFLVVVGRLYYLQIIRGDFYHFFSTENSIKAIKVPAVRGMIFDRRGQVLVDNRPSFNIVVVPQYVVNPERMLSSIERLLKVPPEELQALWEKRKLQASYQPLRAQEGHHRRRGRAHTCAQGPVDRSGGSVRPARRGRGGQTTSAAIRSPTSPPT